MRDVWDKEEGRKMKEEKGCETDGGGGEGK